MNDWRKYRSEFREVSCTVSIFQKTVEHQPELRLEDAGRILKNVFKENNVEPNSVPLEVLTAYSNYRKERFSLQRMIIVIIMVLFMLLPLLFIPSIFTIQTNTAQSEINPTYTLEVTSRMPVKRITAEINGRNVPVYEMDAHVYSIEPMVNGRMAVTVTLVNNQQSVQYIDVGNVDLEAPVLISTETRDGLVYLYLSDTGLGIDYANVSTISAGGEAVKPQFIDEKVGCIALPYPNETLNVYIPDFAENTLQLVISIEGK